MDHATYKVSVLVMEAEDIPGEWVSHCLDFDLVSQGSSPTDALEAIREVIVMVLEDDISQGLDPARRPRAPDSDWEIFSQTIERGQPVEEVADHSQIHTLVAQMRFQLKPHPLTDAPSVSSDAPPAWQFAALERVSCLHD